MNKGVETVKGIGERGVGRLCYFFYVHGCFVTDVSSSPSCSVGHSSEPRCIDLSVTPRFQRWGGPLWVICSATLKFNVS